MSSLAITKNQTTHPRQQPEKGKYGFGEWFSDHMYLLDYDKDHAWHSARIVPYGPLPLEPSATVLHYGQALFEGLKAFRGVDNKIRLFRPDKNWQRLQSGAERLCMQAPDQNTFIQALHELVKMDEKWIPSEPGSALYIRPTLIGTEGFLGVKPAQKYLFYIIASPVGAYFGDKTSTVKIWVEQKYTRAATGGIGAAKTGGNYAASLLAAKEAQKQGYSQVLWLDGKDKKYVEEVGAMNVFFRIKDKVITPALGGTILPGVTRDSVIHLLKNQGVQVEERPLAMDEILEAYKNGHLKEVFGSGTAASIAPVGTLAYGDQVLNINNAAVGELSQNLAQILTDIQYGRAEDKYNWAQIVTI
ncbi:MAG: branched-chain amino acid aminotransferase [Pseudobdellovibrionaceae bacterium]